ncbi:hypothetical protein SGGMMB4_05821 (plasmid) [Sodalis glossinidius str. 'morsitans']|uniref:Uncharacterized protein n=1 Tax=Sodalis glossinidius (strain morsitans) TaxID=343509 RepID=A0A193QPI0_SODGM|nr:hypothetical protein SGGMMB4_05821 [Sodalis glossinidius str. 'morsitans']
MTEGNSQRYDRIRTQSRENATSRLLAVRKAAKRDKRKQFTCIFHQISEALLTQSFLQLKRQSAPGTVQTAASKAGASFLPDAG